MTDDSFGVFNRDEVVRRYDSLTSLFDSERRLFTEFVATGSRVLDLGVGSGRTTGPLAGVASTYVGIDLAPSMIAAARERHPFADLRVGDASDLTAFGAASFDIVVFSFNGLDYLPDDTRSACLDEIARVLVNGGVLIASRHDPRGVIARPNRSLRAKAIPVALLQSARRIGRRVTTRAFWRGSGRVLDTIYGGTVTHMAVPNVVCAELARHGLTPVRTVPGPDGAPGGRWSTEWWYYAAERRSDAMSDR